MLTFVIPVETATGESLKASKLATLHAPFRRADRYPGHLAGRPVHGAFPAVTTPFGQPARSTTLFAVRRVDAHMSDTEDGDDGFDKEAEREKLREKYGDDQEQREATQEMSDLLLRGATMTNQHCGECGNPIFRMDGEQFCPNCGGTRGTAGGESQPAEGPDDEGSDRAAADPGAGAADQPPTAVRSGSGQSPEAGDVDRRPEADGTDRRRVAAGGNQPADDAGGHGDRGAAPRSGTSDRTPAADRTSDANPEGDGEPPSARRSRRGPEPHEASVEEAPSMAQAQASLRRAIVSLSEQAAQSDDPVRAKELLEAAGEAAAALSELGE
jgi:hypothetical protein